jgi:hypothetical protein
VVVVFTVAGSGSWFPIAGLSHAAAVIN